MKGDKKMVTIAILIIALGVGFGLIGASLTMTLASCGKAETTETGGETPPLRSEGTEAPAPEEITRIKLVEGLTLRDVDMVRPEGIEYILNMLNVDTYELVDPEHERAVAVLDEASTILEFHTKDGMYGMAWVTDGCEVVVLLEDGIIEGGGVWYTQTPAVDTVLITAEFGRKP